MGLDVGLDLVPGTIEGGTVAQPSSLLNGLVAGWLMNETSNGSVQVDRVDVLGVATLTDNNTTASNAGGKNGAASDHVFANDEYFSVTTQTPLNGDRTVSLWVYPTNIAAQRPLASGGDTYRDSSPHWLISMRQTGTNVFSVYHGGGYRTGTTAQAALNTWYHVVYTYKHSTTNVGLWINGVREVDVNAADSNAGANNYIGAGYNTAMGGRLDDVYIWNRVLTDDEIAEVYASGASNPYPFT